MKLFDDTVHETNIQDYTQEQVNAWASENMDYSVGLVYSCVVDNESRKLTSTLNIKCQILSLIDYFNRKECKAICLEVFRLAQYCSDWERYFCRDALVQASPLLLRVIYRD
ncbi:hypothetical protein OGM63_28975 [Plectonema radiosum NIES-515]|uniref:Phycobilisome protein n=1 Tax=Plectonema radiosum NIES-515 TaxID=2986073 RepID=A0ABT3B994_9CYAN|nr:hypothetical protein [Plectonema radiosum]MCV3217494.1 hypothetical protein [Plectonema radiosum NIES-515]